MNAKKPKSKGLFSMSKAKKINRSAYMYIGDDLVLKRDSS
jgi:hypothetical protein